MTPDALRQLQDLPRQLLEPPQGLHAPADGPPVIEADTAAASHHIGACVRDRFHQRWEATERSCSAGTRQPGIGDCVT